MSRKGSATAARKRLETVASWGRYLMAGALLAVLVASGIAAQLFATSDTPQGSSLEDADQALYAHGDRLRPLVEEAGNAQTLNIYDTGGRIIGQAGRDGSGGQETRHLLADHLGSTRAGLDGGGNVVAQLEYGPYGKTTAVGAAAEVRYRYTGHPYDESQGLYQTPARGYDPTQGRFLSVDPQRQNASPYVYAGNNPVGFLDPTGGDEFPFYVFTGFEATEWESGTRKMSSTANAVASAFGWFKGGNQYAISAGMFNSIYDSEGVATSSLAENSPHKYTGRTDTDYGKMYLFIGGEVDVDNMERLAEGISAMAGKKQGFARDITIINFSGKEDIGKEIESKFRIAGRYPLLIDAGLETTSHRRGYKVTKFTYGEDDLLPPDFIAYVRLLELEHKPKPLQKVGKAIRFAELVEPSYQHGIEMTDPAKVTGDLSLGFYRGGEFMPFPTVPPVDQVTGQSTDAASVLSGNPHWGTGEGWGNHSRSLSPELVPVLDQTPMETW